MKNERMKPLCASRLLKGLAALSFIIFHLSFSAARKLAALSFIIYHLSFSAALLSFSAALSSCTEADNMYSSAYCRFTFNCSLYPSSALTRAVGSTGGDFCIVKAVNRNGATHLLLTPNRGTYAATDLDLTMNTAITGERISYANMGYNQGLVIGRSLFGTLRCYDLMCPNCDNNYELAWSSEQALEMVCNKCHRVYNIDGEYGYPKSGEKGRALTLYRNVNYTPASGILIVSNP